MKDYTKHLLDQHIAYLYESFQFTKNTYQTVVFRITICAV